MKTYNRIYFVLSFILIVMASCDLAKDLDEFEPQFVLPAETAISDETTAELVLAGVYSGFLQRSGSSGNPYTQIVPAKLGITASNGFAAQGAEDLGFSINQPITVGGTTEGVYTNLYDVINRCNWMIKGLEENVTDEDFTNPARRLEIVGEAKAMRGLHYLYLLRLYGQFYDVNSSFGLDIRLQPATGAEAFARKSVAEVYTAIHADLDDAIINAPDLREKYYVNKTFAKGLKAKVYLYQGEYALAASTAKDVMDNSGPDFALVTTFDELFDHSGIATVSNTEALLDVYGDGDQNNLGSGNFWDGFYATLSSQYATLASTGSMTVNGQVINHDGPRINFIAPLASVGFLENRKMKARSESFETTYHLRMAEIYLIFAEASARADGVNVTAEALQALNDIRIRAGATTTGSDGFETYPATISLAEFLEAVRIEKMMELATENGETWFDLVRYDFADGFGSGFQVSDVKATATNPDKFTLPIPANAVSSSEGLVVQNPSY